MNIRSQKTKALSILLLVSVSASSYSMQYLRKAWNKVSSPIVAGVAITAGLGALAYQMYKVNYSGPQAEPFGQMHVLTPTVTDLPIAAQHYLVAGEGSSVENRVAQVTGIESKEVAPMTHASKKITWADDKGLIPLNKVYEFKNPKSVLTKYKNANALTEKNRLPNAMAMYKGSLALAQSKRTPSRKTRSNTKVAVVASQEAVPVVAIGSIAAQRSEATLANAQMQIAQFARLAQEAQVVRVAQEARKKSEPHGRVSQRSAKR